MVNNLEDIILEIKKLISNNKIDEVFNKLEEILQPQSYVYDTFILIKSNFKSYKQKDSLGVISSEENKLNTSKNNKNILDFVKSLQKGDLKKQEIILKTKSNSPQLCDFYKLDTNNKQLKTCSFLFKTSSKYIRIGLKFIEPKAKLFGSIKRLKSKDNYVLLQIGKNELPTVLKTLCLYNGNTLANNVHLDEFVPNKEYEVSVYISEDSTLEFFFNKELVLKFKINAVLTSNVYLVAWGDNKEFNFKINNLSIQTTNYPQKKLFELTLSEHVNIKIQNEKEGEILKVRRNETIRGTFDFIPDNYQIRALIFNENQNLFWPMDKATYIENSIEKEWSSKVIFGLPEEVGHKFYLVIVLAHINLDYLFTYYHKISQKINHWKPFNLPLIKGLIECKKIQVERI